MMLTDTPKTEGRVGLPREQELTVGLSWVLTMRNLTGAFRCGWRVVAVAGVWQSGGASLSLHPFVPPSFNLRVSATVGNSFNYLILIYYGYHIALVRSNKPCTLRLRRAAWALRSQTW
jgi:hypothetical protein